MVYNPNLKPPKIDPAQKQRDRYDYLARFMYKLTTVNGRHQYPEAGLRRLLFNARVLTRDGHVRIERLRKLARSLGVRDANHPQSKDLPSVFYEDQDVWDYIAEGGS